MKHATSRMLFAYWDALRGERAAPERGDIRPGEMRHVLADAFILAADPPLRPSFRLAGTRVGSLFCRDLKGQPFHSLWPASERRDADLLIRTVLSDTIGLVAGLRGINENGSELTLELLLLPLRHRGRTEVRLIGALSPASIPPWAGLVPIAALETCSVRMIQPRRADQRLEAVSPGARIRQRALLVVHEGGRA